MPCIFQVLLTHDTYSLTLNSPYLKVYSSWMNIATCHPEKSNVKSVKRCKTGEKIKRMREAINDLVGKKI